MSTNHLSFHPHKARSGMATVLGMLIFVGVLFTCVMPFFLYINEANSFYDQKIVEMRHFDEDRVVEQVDVYVYPLNNESDQLNIFIKNRCTLAVKIVRTWINDDCCDSLEEVPAMSVGVIKPINVTLPPTGAKAFNIKLVTSRSNSFSSLTNTLYYGEDGSWSGGMGFSINIVIKTATSLGVRRFSIKVTGPQNFLCECEVLKRSHESSCFATVSLPTTGNYYVTVTEKPGTPLVTDLEVLITLEEPSSWVYIYPD